MACLCQSLLCCLLRPVKLLFCFSFVIVIVIVIVLLLLLLLLIEMWPCGLWRVCDSHSTAVCSVQWQAAVKLKDLFDYFVSQPYCQITKFSTKNSLNQKIPFAFLILCQKLFTLDQQQPHFQCHVSHSGSPLQYQCKTQDPEISYYIMCNTMQYRECLG